MRVLIAAVSVALLAAAGCAGSSARRAPLPRAQQGVGYTISATLDPLRNKIMGRETIHFWNNSARAMSYLMLCQGSPSALTLDSIQVAGKPATPTIDGATMRLELDTPLASGASGASVDVQAAWTLRVPAQGGGRMAHDGPLYEVGQWYPRLCPYGEASGWGSGPAAVAADSVDPRDFDVSLTVPFSYIVRATGELQNPDAVLTPTEISRLALARVSDTTLQVVTNHDLSDFTVFRPVTDGDLTWHFTAHGTPDFAWAAGPDFLWDASGWNGILIETLYRRTAADWSGANRRAREAFEALGAQGRRYPWTHAITIEGPLDGVEYPMLVFAVMPVPRAAPPSPGRNPMR